MFVGDGSDGLAFVFRTSTGEAGFETRNQNGSRVFRYNPAAANGGWHNSIDYPVAADNPLNGNMYKPMYFDRRPGDPRRQQRADLAAEQGLRQAPRSATTRRSSTGSASAASPARSGTPVTSTSPSASRGISD